MSDPLHTKTLKELGNLITLEWNPKPETRVHAYLRTLLHVERLNDYFSGHGGMSGGEAVTGFLRFSREWQGGNAATIKEELESRLQVRERPVTALPLNAIADRFAGHRDGERVSV